MAELPGEASPDREPDPALQSGLSPAARTAQQSGPEPGSGPVEQQEPSAQSGTPAKADEAADEDAEDDLVRSAADLADRIRVRRRMRLAGLEDLGAAWFGGATRFGGPASFGGHAAARDVNLHFYSAAAQLRTLLQTGSIDPARLRRVQSVHVAGPRYAAAERKLREQRLVVLRGAEGFGKRTTALFMLSELADGEVHAISIGHALRVPSDLDLKENVGYLAEIPEAGELTYTRLATFSAELSERDAYLVIVAPADTAVDADTNEYFVVDHEPPDYREVIRRHLELDANHGRQAERLMHSLHAVPFVASPGAAADLARGLLEIVRAGRGANDLDPLFAGMRRRQARRLLSTGQAEKPRERVKLLCRRSALVSIAVFTGLPHADVVVAAEKLAIRFIATEFPKSKGREVFIRWREHILAERDLTIDESEFQGPWGSTPTQRLHFRDPQLHLAVLEELWEHYDTARSPLLAWLRDLAVGSRDEAVRVRAAQVIGRLATRDFDHICHQLILVWAGSISVRAREAAATALEAVATSLAPQVWKLLADWCKDGNRLRQQTAILALGTGISEHDPDEALARLEQLAPRDAGRQGHGMGEAVRYSMTELFSGPHQAIVVRALHSWSRRSSPRLKAVALRCVPPLAHMVDDSGRPLLLLAWPGRSALQAEIAALVAGALETPDTRQETWTALEKLATAVVDDPQLTEALGTLLADLQRGSGIARNQLTFYLRLWAHRHPELTSGSGLREADHDGH